MIKTRIFELRESVDDGVTTSYFAADGKEAEYNRRQLEPNAKLIATFVTTSRFDAMRQRNEYMGREPYKPQPDREDEYRE